MFTSAQVTSLFDLVDKLVTSIAGDKTALAKAQSDLAAMTANDADLNSPDIQARFAATLDKLSAATAAPVVPSPVIPAPPVTPPTPTPTV